MVRGKTTTLCRSRDEPGGVKAQVCFEPGRRGRTTSMPSLVLGSALAFFPGIRSSNSVCRPLQGRGSLPSLEGSPLDPGHEYIIRANLLAQRFALEFKYFCPS